MLTATHLIPDCLPWLLLIQSHIDFAAPLFQTWRFHPLEDYVP